MKWLHSKALALQKKKVKQMERLKDYAGQFFLCFMFFSRLPLPGFLERLVTEDHQLGKSVAYFPIAGFFIALLPASTWFLTSLFFPPLLAAAIAIFAGIATTGALHEDGFADSIEGLCATSDKARALEIMRDSRIGAYGGLALFATTALRWAALASLGPITGALALLISHSGARAAMTPAFSLAVYAREQGLASQVANNISSNAVFLAIAIAALIAFALGQFMALTALIIGIFMAYLALFWLKHRLGGYTGDGLGLMEQVAEITIMLILVAAWA